MGRLKRVSRRLCRTWRSTRLSLRLCANGAHSRGNPPGFDVQAYLDAMTGVDLTQIDGIDSLDGLEGDQ